MSREPREPVPGRPVRSTDYGVPTDEAGLLPWSWAIERLEAARDFWFATTRPDVAARLTAAFTAKFGASHDYGANAVGPGRPLAATAAPRLRLAGVPAQRHALYLR